MKKITQYEGIKFLKNKKIKLVGGIAGIMAAVICTGCSNTNNVSNEIEVTKSIVEEPIIISTQETEEFTEEIVITTTEKTTVTTTEKTTVTTTEPIVTTTEPIVTTTEKTTVTTTEPIVTTTEKTTVTTTEPIVTTTEKTTVTTTEPIVTTTEEPIVTTTEPDDDLEYGGILTSKNINNYDSFINVATYFFSRTSLASGYNVYYNIDNNEYESCYSYARQEKYLFLTILNLDYMDQEILNQLFGTYTKDELKGLCYNIASIFGKDLSKKKYYDYSSIVIDKKLSNLLNEMTEYYKTGNTTKLEQLCNSNLGKYNDLVDIILLGYICNENIITDKFPSEIAYYMAENMNLYDAINSKSFSR